MEEHPHPSAISRLWLGQPQRFEGTVDPMANSGGPYESYSYQQLYAMLRECQRDASRYRSQPVSLYTEERRHASERSTNNRNLIGEINAELEFRERDKVEREQRQERREAAREAREKAREERPAKESAARAVAREARVAGAVGAPAKPPEPSGPCMTHPVGLALAAYFRRTNIKELPPVTTSRMELAWSHNRRQFIAFYSESTGALEVWIQVATGTRGATNINGNDYMAASDNKLIHQAHVAEAKARRRS